MWHISLNILFSIVSNISISVNNSSYIWVFFKHICHVIERERKKVSLINLKYLIVLAANVFKYISCPAQTDHDVYLPRVFILKSLHNILACLWSASVIYSMFKLLYFFLSNNNVSLSFYQLYPCVHMDKHLFATSNSFP